MAESQIDMTPECLVGSWSKRVITKYSAVHIIKWNFHLIRNVNKHHSFMYKELLRHRAVLPAITRHLVYCIMLQFVSMRWVRFHSPACASMRRRSASRWRESSSKASCSLQFNVSESRLWSPLLLLRELSPSCASMRCRARPCALIRVHAVQCAPMRLLLGPAGRAKKCPQCDKCALWRSTADSQCDMIMSCFDAMPTVSRCWLTGGRSVGMGWGAIFAVAQLSCFSMQ